MNGLQEFTRLKEEHERMQMTVQLRTEEETLAYLSAFLPLETFFRELWQAKKDVYFWDHPEYIKETGWFKYQFYNANICVARHFRYDMHREHQHDFFQMNCILGGTGTVEVEGEALTVTEGDYLLMAPHVRHCIRVFNDDCLWLKLYIRKSTFEKTFFDWLGQNNILSAFFRQTLYGEGSNYILFHTAGDEMLRKLTLRLYAEMMNAEEYYRIVGEAQLIELFCRLVRDHITQSETPSDSEKRTTIGSIIRYMKTNYRTTDLTDTARQVGYSRNYLCRILSGVMGRTYTELLNEIRIEAAQNLLTTTSMTAAEIAAHVGFHSSEHFHRVFRKLTGLSPLKWREVRGREGE